MATALTATLRADITQFERAIQQAETRITGLQRSTTQVNRELQKFGNDFGGATLIRQANSMAKAVEDIGGVTKLTAAEQKRLAGTVDEALAKYRSLGQEVPPALVKVSAALEQIRQAEEQAQRGAEALREAQKRAAAEQTKALQDAARAQQQLATNLNTIGGGLTRAGAVLTAAVTAPIVAGFALSIKSAKDFESAFANVVKTVNGLNVDAFGKLTPEAQQLSREIRNLAKEIPVAATELANIAAIGGQFGVERKNLVAFTETVAKLGVAVDGISAEEAAAAIAQISKVAGLAEEDFSKLASAVVDLGNSGNSTEADILELSKRFAGAGAAAGLSAAEIAGVSAAIANVGINAEAGGTAISKTFNDIGAAVARGGKELDAFAAIAGKSSTEFAQIFKNDAVKAIDLFIGGLRRAKDAGQDLTVILDSVNIKEVRQSDTLRRLAGDYDNFSKTVDQSRQAFDKNTALAEEARKKFATFENQLQLFQNRLTDIGIELGGPLLQGLRGLLDAADPLIKAAGEAAKSFAEMSDQGKLATVALVGAAGLAPAMLLVAGQTLQAVSSVLDFVKALKELQKAKAAADGLSAASAATGALGQSADGATKSLAGQLGLAGALTAVALAGEQLAQTAETDISASLDKIGGKAATLGQVIKQLEVIQNLAKGGLVGTAIGLGTSAAKAGAGALFGGGGPSKADQELRGLDAGLSNTIGGGDAAAVEKTTAALGRRVDVVTKLSKEQKQAADEAKKLAAEMDKLTGQDKIAAAQKLNDTIRRIDFNHIDPKNLKDIHKTFEDAIKAADRMGKEVPGDWRLIEQATKPALQATQLFKGELIKVIGVGSDLGKAFQLDRQTAALVSGLMNVKKGVAELGAETIQQVKHQQEAESAAHRWATAMGALSSAFADLGQIGGDSLSGIIAQVAQLVGLMNTGAQAGVGLRNTFGIGSGQAFRGFRNEAGNFTTGSIAAGSAQAFAQGASAVSALDQATNVKGRGNRAARGALTGASIGNSIVPGYGALVGAAVGALVGAFRNPAFEDVYKRVAKNFGVELSDETAKAIAKVAKEQFKGDRGTAEIFSLDKIIAEGGGIKPSTVSKLTARLRDAFVGADLGKLSSEQLSEILEKNYGTFADFVLKSNEIAGKGFAEIARLAKAAGVDVAAIREFALGQTARVGSGLEALAGPLFDAAGIQEQIKAAQQAQAEAAQRVGAAREGKSDADLGVGDRERVSAAEAEQAQAAQVVAELTAKMGAAAGDAQGEFDRLGVIAVGAFNAARASGLGYLESVDQLSPGLDRLNEIQDQLGLKSNAAFEELSKFRDLVGNNESLVASAEALNETILALSNIGGLTVETLAAMEEQGLATFERLTAAGFTENQALEIQREFLENLEKAHQQLGVPIGENTQKLIDQGKELEGLGPKSPAEALAAGFDSVVLAVNRLAKGLGIDVPEAAEAAASAVEGSSSRASAAATASAETIAKKGTDAFRDLERDAVRSQDGISEKIRKAAEKGTVYYKGFADVAADSSDEASQDLDRYWQGYYRMQEEALEDSSSNLRSFVDDANEALKKISRKIEIEFHYSQTGQVPSGAPSGDSVPGLASGGIVRARPGGTIVRLAEGGQDEAVIPLGRGSSGITVPMLVSALSKVQFVGLLEGGGRPLLRYVGRDLPAYIETRTGQRVPL